MTLAAVVALVLAAGALAYVLAPLFGVARDGDASAPGPSGAPAAASDITDEVVEAALRAYRAARPECPICGPCPEADAAYCSTCGRPVIGVDGRTRA